jgi:hypothetical protein
MTITLTFRHPPTHHRFSWRWLAAGAAAVAIGAGVYVGSQALTSSEPDAVPDGTTVADPSGLGAILSTQYPTVSVSTDDPTGLSQVFGVHVPTQASPADPSGLGAILSTQYPTVSASAADPTGLGQVFGVQFP